MSFKSKLKKIVKRNNSYLCVGLDPDEDKIQKLYPKKSVLAFLKGVIKQTQDVVSCYKPNIAFFESMGIQGMKILKQVLSYIPSEIPVILDAKRGDIGNTANQYAKAFFDELKVDAVTVNPYMGFDSVEPFMRYKNKEIFVLLLTSNKGAKDFQFLKVGQQPLYMKVANKIKTWNDNDNLGAVVGATKPEDMKTIRKVLKNNIFLIPGIGTQGGDLEKSVKYAFSNAGVGLFNISRAVLYAPSMAKVREKAIKYRDLINSYL